MRFTSLALAIALPFTMPMAGFAAGGDTTTPPTPSDTTKKCWGKRVWDEDAQKCVKPEESSLSDEQLLQTARELAYLERFEDAQAVLAAHPDQTDSRVLTYWGFTHRKLGHSSEAKDYYTHAIAQDPDNILARSYMAQGFVETGEYAQALVQWKEIRARGGDGTWAEASLRQAIQTGVTVNY
ncbi:tetratricopeptide repeat protein [Tritonibacter scottomollicae]|uniref:tetratricopeptide repeat protein n=1 Tax=Tritonibacter scottomollicae TaxID=483013 RepID=UPI003AA7DD97